MEIKRFVGGELESNGYIGYDKVGGDCYIIDPGYNSEKYVEFIKVNSLNPLGIIFTHHHYDHITDGPKVAEMLNCEMYVEERDFEPCVDTLKEGSKRLEKIKDGHTFKLGDENLKVISMQGHTKGGICIVDEKAKVAFTGDVVFATEIGITNLEDGSPEEMAESCLKISKWADDIIIYPGHGDYATIKSVKENNEEFKQALAMVN